MPEIEYVKFFDVGKPELKKHKKQQIKKDNKRNKYTKV